jgi:hypothetical protein
MAIGDDTILERLYAAEEALQSQADALDTKAGIILAILTFLADFVTGLKFSPAWLFVAIVYLSLSGLLAALSLIFLKYKGEDATALGTWRDKVVVANEGQSDAVIEDALKQGLMEASKERVTLNGRFNQIKARMLMASYIALLCALVLGFVQMATHALGAH